MGRSFDLMRNYPKSKRDTKERADQKTEEDRKIARQFGKEYFDGDRRYGYGGYFYNPRFWESVIPDFVRYFKINKNSSILDVGCGKGFMLYDLWRLIPGIKINGIDFSDYAIKNCKEEMSPFLQVGDARNIPFPDNSFDVVFSITTLHNLDREGCAQGLREIERVSRGKSFVTLDAYRNEKERKEMEEWNLTALTVMHVDKWKEFFDEIGYSGDYYWFMPAT